MATCPECDFEIDIDEFDGDVEKGDPVTCPECGSNLEVSSVSPLELDLAPDDEEDEFDDDGDEFDEETEEEEDEE
jgi:alpha-aminoadipate carrier protein LysW